MSNSSAGRRLAALLGPAIQQTGLDLEDVEVTSAGKRRLVRVLVDKDGGVSLDDVALVSQSISTVLDSSPDADAVLGSAAYVLEVSSPGVDRPLVEPRHWRRARGRLVTVSLTSGGEIDGRVIEADAGGVRLALETPAEPVRVLAFDEIRQGRVRVEFNRPASAADADDVEGSFLPSHAEESW